MIQHMEPGRRVVVKEFHSNLGDRKDLTCYVRGRWVPFGGKGHLPTLGTSTSGRLHSVQAALERAQVSKKSPES